MAVTRKLISAGAICVALAFFLSFGSTPAAAAPYPPVPPTNGVLVPAAAQVQAPNVDAIQIAPGSFPVQARTGSPSSADAGSAVVVAVVAAALVLLTLSFGPLVGRRFRIRSVLP